MADRKTGRKEAIVHERCKLARGMKCLNLNDLPLRHIPYEVYSLTSLKHLYLHNCKIIDDFPIDLIHIRELSSLDLSQNSITILPEVFCMHAKKLTMLDVSYNNLTRLPGEIINMAALKELNAAYNNLIYIPTEIGQLENLEYLDMSNNNILGIPTVLFHGQANATLKTLKLQNNKIKELPDSIGMLQVLVELDISNNRIKYLPTDVRNLRLVEAFIYGGNKWIGEHHLKSNSAHGVNALSLLYRLSL